MTISGTGEHMAIGSINLGLIIKISSQQLPEWWKPAKTQKQNGERFECLLCIWLNYCDMAVSIIEVPGSNPGTDVGVCVHGHEELGLRLETKCYTVHETLQKILECVMYDESLAAILVSHGHK